jgi:hypothetical protein
MAPPKSKSFSVSVVLPASGWEIMPKVRRFSVASVNLMGLNIKKDRKAVFNNLFVWRN